MNILKFIKGRNSTTAKDVERNNQVLDGLVTEIDSAQRIARVLHTEAYTPWSNADNKDLVNAFKKRLGTDNYGLLTPDDRQHLIRLVANDVNRSPAAVLLRLRPTGLIKVKGNSKKTLKDIQDKAKKVAKGA